MTDYRVTTDLRVVVTVHASAEGAAYSDARRELEAGAGSVPEVSFDVRGTAVYEHPTAPFEPYRVAVEATATARVEADDPGQARDRAAERVRAAIAALDADDPEFTDEASVAAV